jgi:dolichyl-phosphate beta-glucosyltransferase
MDNRELFLSVIIPCYNEWENLEHGVLDEVIAFLQTLQFRWELIISDDGSTDESSEFIEKFLVGKKNIFLLKNFHGGKPTAVYQGIKAAQGEYLLFTDMDQSTPIGELQKLLPYLDQYEVVIGSRAERKNFPWYRKIGSKVFKYFRKTILLRRINDTQCGFKVFKTVLAKEIFPKLQCFRKQDEVKGWKVTSFDVELLHLVDIRYKKIKEVSVDWEDRDLAKGKEKKYFKESSDMLKEIFRIKINDMLGYYKIPK